MARPTKQGIDYFPLDCEFDDKTQMYLLEKGAVGLAVLITTWQKIYSNEGYYIDNTIDLHLLIKQKIDVGINEVSDCINVCLRRNIFDNNLGSAYGILTSKAIQKRFFDIAKKKKSVTFTKEFLLVSVDSVKNLVNVGINPVNSGENATNVKVEVKEEVKVKEKVFENTLSSNPKLDLVDNFSEPDEILKSETQISQATEILDFMNEKLNRNFRAKSPDGKKTANAELVIKLIKAGYTSSDLRQVVARKKREWENSDMEIYLRPATLFRKSNFESYLAECVLPKKPENDFEDFDDFGDLEETNSPDIFDDNLGTDEL